MKTGRTHYSSGIGRTLLGALAFVVLVALATPQIAQASTAANTTIRNEVTINYDDSAGTAMAPVTAQADVTVTLVAAAPTLSAPTDQSTDPGTNAVYSYTLTSAANGPDTYNLTVDSTTDSAGDFNTASSTSLSAASLTLGATTVATADTIAAAGTTAITVASDDTADSAVNGIGLGDTVVINTQVFTVASVTDNGGSPGTSTITVNGNGTATAIAVGDVIGERQSFTLTVTPGTLVAAPTSPTITITIGAQDSAASTTKQQDETVTAVNVSSLSVTKDVSTDGGATFAATANAAPGATLTYRVTVTNNGSSNATNVVITDPEPQFTTYVGASAKTSTTLNDTYGSASNTDLGDVDTDGDGYDFGNTTGSTATFSAGGIAPGNSVLLFFQVTIDN